MNERKIGYILSGLLFFSSLIFLFSFNTVFTNIFSNKSYLNEDLNVKDNFDLRSSDSPLFEYSGIGQAQNITEYGVGEFTNNGLNLNNNDNATIIVAENWNANQVECNISNIYDYNSVFVNETFDLGFDKSRWSNYTDRPENVTFGFYSNPESQNDSIYIRFEDAGASWSGIDSYVNYTFNLPRLHIPYLKDWNLNYNFWAQWNDPAWKTGIGGAVHYSAIYLNGIDVRFSEKLTDLVENNTVYQSSIPLFTAEDYGFSLPGTISILFGVDFGNSPINPSGFFKLFFDNITFSLSTIPKPSQINLKIVDNTNSFVETPINDIEQGKGTITLQNTWKGAPMGAYHLFGFSTNSSGTILLNSKFFVTATSLTNTKTQLGDIGSEFQVENNTKTKWTMYIPVILPGAYYNGYYFNISKPLNWNITEVIDPYLNNRIDDVIGTGYGNTSFTIPNHILNNGLWKFVAEAPNYVNEVNIYKKNGLDWIQNSTFQINDKLKINASIATELISDITLTRACLQIFYPNGNLFYTENASVASDAIVEFSEIIFGANNASAGNYIIYVKWSNQEDSMSQVGFYVTNFVVVHQTELTAITPYFELYVGDPLLVRVQFIDLDLNTSIPFATVIYNSSFGSFGIMIYQGSGIYFAEIDTNSLELGDYYFSFNATRDFYQSQIKYDLIHLRIIAQPLALEVPKDAVYSIGNDYAICQINVTGAFTYSLIWNASVSTNWLNPYSVIDHYNGTYTLNFSTYNLPSKGIIETFTVSVYANKTDYGDTTGFITIIVNPIETEVSVSQSVINANLEEIIDINVNYSILGSELIIQGANCSVDWIGSYNITPEGDGFIVSLDTATLSIDTYTAILKLEKPGFKTGYKTITIIINRLSMLFHTIGFQDAMDVFMGDTITIRINLTEPETKIDIENATIFYSWELGLGYFEYISNGIYELTVKLPETIEGSYKMTLVATKEDSIYQPTEFSFIIAITKRPTPNYIFLFIVIGLILGLALLGVLSFRAYIYIPAKRKKKSELLAKTQRFKDAMNVQGLVISERESGLALFTKSYYAWEASKKDLLSGFIYAITTISQEFMEKEAVKDMTYDKEEIETIEKIIELDFQYFNFLICDYKSFRAVFILRDQASERLKKHAMDILITLDSQLAPILEKWDGSLEKFEKIIPATIDNCCQLYYREQFVLNKPKFINKVLAQIELNKMESRVINVIRSMTRSVSEFHLNDVVELVGEKNKDLVIKGIESVIEKNLIIPAPKNN